MTLKDKLHDFPLNVESPLESGFYIKCKFARCQGLTPVILATWEAEIRRPTWANSL
jgi:hypothetical protein